MFRAAASGGHGAMVHRCPPKVASRCWFVGDQVLATPLLARLKHHHRASRVWPSTTSYNVLCQLRQLGTLLVRERVVRDCRKVLTYRVRRSARSQHRKVRVPLAKKSRQEWLSRRAVQSELGPARGGRHGGCCWRCGESAEGSERARRRAPHALHVCVTNGSHVMRQLAVGAQDASVQPERACARGRHASTFANTRGCFLL